MCDYMSSIPCIQDAEEGEPWGGAVLQKCSSSSLSLNTIILLIRNCRILVLYMPHMHVFLLSGQYACPFLRIGKRNLYNTEDMIL
jgi:hypothetical protein